MMKLCALDDTTKPRTKNWAALEMVVFKRVNKAH